VLAGYVRRKRHLAKGSKGDGKDCAPISAITLFACNVKYRMEL
jgi:hypothetical protein